MAIYTPDARELDQLQQQMGTMAFTYARIGRELQMHSTDAPEQIVAKLDQAKRWMKTLREQACYLRRDAANLERKQRKAFEGKAVR